MLTHIAKTDLFAARTVLNPKALCIFLSLLYSYPKATEKGTENKQVNKILLCLSGQTGQTHTWIYFYLNPFFLSHRAPEAESQEFPQPHLQAAFHRFKSVLPKHFTPHSLLTTTLLLHWQLARVNPAEKKYHSGRKMVVSSIRFLIQVSKRTSALVHNRRQQLWLQI